MAWKQTDKPVNNLGAVVQAANDASAIPPLPAIPLSASDLARLVDMPRPELLALLQRVSEAGWHDGKLKGSALLKTALLSDNEVYDAFMLKGSTLALNATDWREFQGLSEQWTVRKKGKVVDRVEVNQTGSISVFAPDIAGLCGLIADLAAKRTSAAVPGDVSSRPLLPAPVRAE